VEFIQKCSGENVFEKQPLERLGRSEDENHDWFREIDCVYG
jgi:hypothetical protein